MRQSRQSALALALFAALLVALASGLRPDAFFVGDPGIKLIVARAAIANPAHPLDIALPVIGQARLPFVEPFFEVHDDHAHAVTSELFPLLSAPLIGWLGPRGAYVLPAFGFLGILASCAWLAVVLDRRRTPVMVIVVAGVCTPFLFYGLEFWEHAPAVAIGTTAAALFISGAASGRAPVPAGGALFPPGLLLASGVLFGVAILLRPEAACFLVVVLVASRSLDRAPRWTAIVAVTFGALLALAPLEVYTLIHFGRIVPSHIGANSGLVTSGWAAGRLSLVAAWLLPSGWGGTGPASVASFWTVAPAAVLALVPLPAGATRSGRRFLAVTAALTVLLVWLTAPNDGGGQWGPRYLLFAYVPLVILAADAVEALPRRPAVVIALALVLAVSVYIQRSAYRQLRGAKATYGEVVDFVAREVPPGGYIVTDLWWLDQVAAGATIDRRLLFAANATDSAGIMRRMSDAIVPIVTVIRSRSESPDTGGWTEGTCYVEIQRTTIPVRDLVAIVLHHRCRS